MRWWLWQLSELGRCELRGRNGHQMVLVRRSLTQRRIGVVAMLWLMRRCLLCGMRSLVLAVDRAWMHGRGGMCGLAGHLHPVRICRLALRRTVLTLRSILIQLMLWRLLLLLWPMLRWLTHVLWRVNVLMLWRLMLIDRDVLIDGLAEIVIAAPAGLLLMNAGQRLRPDYWWGWIY